MLRETLPIALLLTVAASGCTTFVASPFCQYAETADFVLKGPSETGFASVDCHAPAGLTAPSTRISIDCGEPLDMDLDHNVEGAVDVEIFRDGASVGTTVFSGILSTTAEPSGSTWGLHLAPQPGTSSYYVAIGCAQG